MRFQRPSELSKGDVRLTEADRKSVPQTWNAIQLAVWRG